MKARGKEHVFLLHLLAISSTLVVRSPPSSFGQAPETPVFHQDVAWSPEGARLAFSARHNGSWHVYVADLATGEVRPLTSGASQDTWTTWSPDGLQVAFSSSVSGQPADPFVTSIAASGVTTRLTTQQGDRSSQPAWSPDGRRIAFVAKRGAAHQQIWLMNRDGSAPQPLTALAMDAESPQWSRDGSRLVFYSDAGNRRDQIWTIHADGHGLTAVTHDTANNIYPSWTPDGELVWSQQVGGDTRLVHARADGSNAAPLVSQAAFFARVSPDGKSIALIVGHYPSTTLTVCDLRGEHCRAINPPPA
ncbi:MAG TPA: hypothetical protein VM736_01365 [Gemmatimonadales bacterium]|nr:hypothetical protein [Gemmatimonadales bacterium]